MIPVEHYLWIGVALFSIGLTTVIVKKNTIMVLLGVELMLNGANVNLVAFSRYDANLQGQVFALFVIVIAAAEAAIALAIVMKVYQYFQTADLDKIDELKG